MTFSSCCCCSCANIGTTFKYWTRLRHRIAIASCHYRRNHYYSLTCISTPRNHHYSHNRASSLKTRVFPLLRSRSTTVGVVNSLLPHEKSSGLGNGSVRSAWNVQKSHRHSNSNNKDNSSSDSTQSKPQSSHHQSESSSSDITLASSLESILFATAKDAKALNKLPLYRTMVLAPGESADANSQQDLSSSNNQLMNTMQQPTASPVTSIEITSDSLHLHFSDPKNPTYQHFCDLLQKFEEEKGWKELWRREKLLQENRSNAQSNHETATKEASQEASSSAEHAESTDETNVLLGLIPKQIRNLSSLGGGYIVELDRKDFLNYVKYQAEEQGVNVHYEALLEASHKRDDSTED